VARPAPTAHAPSGTLVIRDGRIVYATESIGALVERDAAALVGMSYLDLVAPEDRTRLSDRHERRLRGEPVPGEYEAMLALPDGRRRVVEFVVERDGSEVLLRVRDVSAQAARRPRLESLAALGAAIQRERSEPNVFTRVADGLWQLGLSSLLARAEPDGIRVEWTRLPDAIDAAAHAHLGRDRSRAPRGTRAPRTPTTGAKWPAASSPTRRRARRAPSPSRTGSRTRSPSGSTSGPRSASTSS
jgi:PAS domain S-box-containing protein